MISLNSYAQENILSKDSIATKNITKDSIISLRLKNKNLDSILKFNTKNPMPKRAGFYSAIIPGLGQVYNRKYIKAGVVWLGLGAAITNTVLKYNDYQNSRTAYVYRVDNDPSTISDSTFNVYDADALKQIQADDKRRLEKSYLYIGGVYLLNIADALVTAHLKSFDVSDDISFKIKPVIINNNIGIGICLKY